MKSIYASKLYRASKRKDRIDAAIIAPTNLSLVQQLADSLDEEYQTPENLGVPSSKPENEEPENEETSSLDDFVVDEEVNPETDLMTLDDLNEGNKSSKGHSKPSAPVHNDKPEKEESKEDTSELIPDSPATEQKPKETEKPSEPEASTNLEGQQNIKATTLADLSVLKNTLNSRQDTSGVTRIAEKEKEIWIYYNDDVNLNNIMTDVIEYLLDSGYEMFEFNRLARSDNAIVFVKEECTQEDPKSIDELEEE